MQVAPIELNVHLLETRLPRHFLRLQLEYGQMIKRERKRCRRDSDLHNTSRSSGGSAPRLGSPVRATARIEDQQTDAMLRLTLGPILASIPKFILMMAILLPVRQSHFDHIYKITKTDIQPRGLSTTAAACSAASTKARPGSSTESSPDAHPYRLAANHL